MAKKKIDKPAKKVETRASIDLKKQIKNVEVGVKNGVFTFTSPLSIAELAPKLNKNPSEIIKYFFMKGKMNNLQTILNEEEIGELCLEYGYDFKIEKAIGLDNLLENINFDDDEASLQTRPPVVTIMGHVDHGKTTLLDAIRSSHITSGEAGGITQHIGAYQVVQNNKKITFIDTPGHEAFSSMRARGANITDLVILVVAADDGIKVQTEEAIDHTKAADVPMIVFVNKMDKEAANPDKVMSQLSDYGVVCEEWGGDTIFIKGSALKGEGIDILLDAINLQADIADYKANPNRLAYGTTIEANLDKGYGPVASILVQNGTLRKGDFVVIGDSYGRVRAMFNDLGKEVFEASPSTPVKIAGLSTIPSAGDKFLALDNEKDAKLLANEIHLKKAKLEWSRLASARDDNNDSSIKTLNLVLRTDVQGSLEAIRGLVDKIEVPGTKINLIRSTTGNVTESDVKLAKAANAVVIGFNIRPNKTIKDYAQSCDTELLTFDIIYKLKEWILARLVGQLDPVIVEKNIGEAYVQAIWKHSKIGTIAGCKVTDGKIKRNAKARVVRDGVVVYNSTISSLKHGKDDAREMFAGQECGLTILNFNDIKEGDIIEVYELDEQSHDVNEYGQ